MAAVCKQERSETRLRLGLPTAERQASKGSCRQRPGNSRRAHQSTVGEATTSHRQGS